MDRGVHGAKLAVEDDSKKFFVIKVFGKKIRVSNFHSSCLSLNKKINKVDIHCQAFIICWIDSMLAAFTFFYHLLTPSYKE